MFKWNRGLCWMVSEKEGKKTTQKKKLGKSEKIKRCEHRTKEREERVTEKVKERKKERVDGMEIGDGDAVQIRHNGTKQVIGLRQFRIPQLGWRTSIRLKLTEKKKRQKKRGLGKERRIGLANGINWSVSSACPVENLNRKCRKGPGYRTYGGLRR